MYRLSSLLLGILLLCALPVQAMITTGRPGHGFIGYGITMFKPVCAYACHDSITNQLECSTPDTSMPGMVMWDTSPDCYANNDPYLQTLAYCMSTHCQDVDVWRLERYWKMNVAGRHMHQPLPKYSYQEALTRIQEPPNSTASKDEKLTAVSLVDEESYRDNANTLANFEETEDQHDCYGLVLLLSGSLLPIAFSMLRFLPIPRRLASRFAAMFVYAPLFGSWEPAATPMPTRGQAFMILYFFSLNIIFCAVGYQTTWPNTWFSWKGNQVATYVANRAGVLSAANMALLTLYAGCNNFLLWVTDWSHATFLLLHRYIAFIAVVQACLHSAIYLGVYLDPRNDESHASESKLPYWYWGIISTLALTLLLPLSLPQLRQKLYEVFLMTHVVFALLAYVAYYLHIERRFSHQWGYETWIYIAFAVWVFDRLMRILRMLRNGIRTGHVTIIDDDYIRLDVTGVAATGGHAYLAFPTLTWRVWETHPFSIVGGFLPRACGDDVDLQNESTSGCVSPDTKALATKESIDALPDCQSNAPEARPDILPLAGVGLTFIVRTRNGMTSHLRKRKTLPVLVEGPYETAFRGIDILSYPKILCIAGGVGITAVVRLFDHHLRLAESFTGASEPVPAWLTLWATSSRVFAWLVSWFKSDRVFA